MGCTNWNPVDQWMIMSAPSKAMVMKLVKDVFQDHLCKDKQMDPVLNKRDIYHATATRMGRQS